MPIRLAVNYKFVNQVYGFLFPEGSGSSMISITCWYTKRQVFLKRLPKSMIDSTAHRISVTKEEPWI